MSAACVADSIRTASPATVPRMRLLHVSPAYAPFTGGAEEYARQLSERLAKAGHTVTVLTTGVKHAQEIWEGRPAEARTVFVDSCGVTVHRLPVRPWPPAPWAFHLIHRLAQQVSRVRGDPAHILAGLLPRVPHLSEVLRGLPTVDVIHAVNLTFPALAVGALREAVRRGVPFMITPFLHLSDSRTYPRTLVREAAVVLAQSRSEVNRLIKLGVAPQRIALTGVGVDMDAVRHGDAERFRQAHGLGDDPIVAFVGTASPDKGVLHLCRAMERLWQQGVRARLVMVGPISPQVMSALSVDERCIHLGVISDEIKRDLLAAAAMLVMPSRVESLGLAYLEAWATGLPVIGASIGATPDLIGHGSNGWLVPFGAVTELANAIQRLLSDDELRQRLGTNGRRLVEARYAWDHVLPHIVQTYEQALGQCWPG